MAVLVVDYSRPWSVMERLEHWVEVLDKHIESMKVGLWNVQILCCSILESHPATATLFKAK